MCHSLPYMEIPDMGVGQVLLRRNFQNRRVGFMNMWCGAAGIEGIKVETGNFQTHMQVALENDGPVTLLLDSKKLF